MRVIIAVEEGLQIQVDCPDVAWSTEVLDDMSTRALALFTEAMHACEAVEEAEAGE